MKKWVKLWVMLDAYFIDMFVHIGDLNTPHSPRVWERGHEDITLHGFHIKCKKEKKNLFF